MKEIPCGEVVISFLDKYKITPADLTTSQMKSLVKVICGNKADSKKVVKGVRNENYRHGNTRLR